MQGRSRTGKTAAPAGLTAGAARETGSGDGYHLVPRLGDGVL